MERERERDERERTGVREDWFGARERIGLEPERENCSERERIGARERIERERKD